MLIRYIGPNAVVLLVVLKSEELRSSMLENVLAVEHRTYLQKLNLSTRFDVYGYIGDVTSVCLRDVY